MENKPIIPTAAGSEQQQDSSQPLPHLEKYLPWTKEAGKVIMTLLTLGLTREQVTEALLGEEVTLIGEIVNPDDHRPLLVSSAKVTVRIGDHGRTCAVLVDGKTLGNYFREYYEREILLKDAAGQSEVVRKLYEENLEMRRILGGKARVYK